MTDVLQAEKRQQLGSAATRRLRRAGQVPAVLYGHGEKNEHLAVPSVQVRTLLRHHSKMIKLTGALQETALISEMQWDPLGLEVLHLDLIRVNLREKVDISVPIHTHGDPIGVREGGVLLENVYEVEVRCPAGSIPESLGLDVNELHLNENLTAGDLELPDGVELVTPPETVVAHVEEPRVAPTEEELEGAEEGEPEVIARGGEEGEQESEEA